jgi:hypothetical protein
VAKLGGFLARKNDLEPGPIALWKGWKRLFDLAEGVLCFIFAAWTLHVYKFLSALAEPRLLSGVRENRTPSF